MEDPWDEEGTAKRACNDELQRELLFTQSHENKLREIEGATRPSAFTTEQLNNCPVRLAMEPSERVFPQDLIKTDNLNLQKMLTVFTYLCDEINELKDMAESKLYGPLVVFGQQVCETTVDDDVRTGTFNPGDRERMIGNFLPNLQELCNFIDRCYFVAVNLVQQLAAAFSAKEYFYRSLFNWPACHLQHVSLTFLIDFRFLLATSFLLFNFDIISIGFVHVIRTANYPYNH
jgi:hypothetical protein